MENQKKHVNLFFADTQKYKNYAALDVDTERTKNKDFTRIIFYNNM